MNDTTFPLARNAVFWTVQGEGVHLGVPMVLVRLGGCSVGCEHCDTDYRVQRRATAREIAMEVAAVMPATTQWIWLTGGEPADHDLYPLVEELRHLGHIALATSGTKPLGPAEQSVSFLSVSPHKTPAELVLKSASQINLVPGLNGLKLADWEGFDVRPYGAAWVTTCDGYDTLPECLAWLKKHPGWRLNAQAHKQWDLP